MSVLLMAGDNHGASSLFRRAEQIRRWKESETNRQEYSDSPRKKAVKFSDECIFLAAAAAGDRDELVQLLQRGADINTVNQDGITALHAVSFPIYILIMCFISKYNLRLQTNHSFISNLLRPRASISRWLPLAL